MLFLLSIFTGCYTGMSERLTRDVSAASVRTAAGETRGVGQDPRVRRDAIDLSRSMGRWTGRSIFGRGR